MEIEVKTQNRRGGIPQYKENLGYATTFIDGNRITVDNYKGQGESYEKREQPKVTIIIRGVEMFVGTFEELQNRLTPESLL